LEQVLHATAAGVQGLVADELRQDFGADGIGEMVEQDRAAEAAAAAAAPLGGLGHFALSVHSVGQSNARRPVLLSGKPLLTGRSNDGGASIADRDQFGRWS
jgi:hypothetical protein